MTTSRMSDTRSLSLDRKFLDEASDALREANLLFASQHPGEKESRQPVHTVYGGAQLFSFDTAAKIRRFAQQAMTEYAPDAAALGEALGIIEHPALATIDSRVREKIGREAVEDFRIDFEDGYGNRPDDEEDRQAAIVAEQIIRGVDEQTLPPFIGMRIKPLNEELRGRSVRTLDLVMTALAKAGKVPDNWIITVPKITIIEQVEYIVRVLGELERVLGFDDGALRFEAMVETPQIILDSRGRSLLPQLVEAAEGRLSAAHFGTYDYTAGSNITAAYQGMQHPACEFAKHVMQVALAGTGVWLSDGSTAVLPVPIHKGNALSHDQRDANTASVHGAWKMHFDDVRHSLAGGFYQGWDLHPAQLVSRYGALYSFFLEGIDAAGARLKNFVDRAAQATLVGDVFDDAATGQGLLNFFLRGINSGAITEAEALAMTGLTADEFRGRSFVKIMKGRA
jgi:citrate lyase beta subunit